MNTEVREKGTGACPKCGMALEPVDVSPITRSSGHARCTRRSGRMARAHVRSAAWLSSRDRDARREQPELEDMTRRFWWSSAFTVPMLAFMVSEFLPTEPLQRLLPPGSLNWIELALATPVVLWGGWPFFVRGWASVVNRHLNMFTLIAIGVGAALHTASSRRLLPASSRIRSG